MNKDQEINNLKELYEEERNKGAVRKFMYESQVRALKSINALFLRNKKEPDIDYKKAFEMLRDLAEQGKDGRIKYIDTASHPQQMHERR